MPACHISSSQVATESVIIGLVSALAISQASAQETELDETIDTVIVRGQKIERTLQETKESVAVVSDIVIEELVLLDLDDLFSATPNAYTFNGGQTFGLRGVTQNSSGTGGGAGELATLYIDDVAYTGFSNRFGPTDLWDVEQVEVLRGPQSTNVGRNALAGAVFMATKRPNTDEFEAAFRGQAGSYDTYSAEGMVNVPLTDNSALRLTAEIFQSDGYIENTTLNQDDYDARDNRTYRAKYLVEPTDRLSIYLSAQYADTERGENLYRADLTGEESYTSAANVPGFDRYEAFTASLDVEYELSDKISIRSITSFIDGDYSRVDDDDQGPDGGNAFRGREAEDRNWAEDLRIVYSGDKFEGAIGFYYTEVEALNRTTGLVNIAPAGLGVPDILLLP